MRAPDVWQQGGACRNNKLSTGSLHVMAYNSRFMTVTVRSFAKINLGLYIGAARADGFHDLRAS
jgi:hypothetical protein